MDRPLIDQPRYVSAAQLAMIYPYKPKTWARWAQAGKIPGCLRPAGLHGRLLIPLDAAHRLMHGEAVEAK
jgi:hypothetical protein